MSEFIISVLNSIGYPAIVLIEMLEGMGIPVPGETVLLVSSIYAGVSGKFNIIIVIILSTFGSFLGDNIGYIIGRTKGHELIEKYGKKIHITHDKLKVVEKYFDEKGEIIVFFGRFTTILRIFSPLVAGMNEMNYKKFAIFNFLGCFAWTIVYALIGYYGGKDLKYLERVVGPLGLLVSAIVLGILILTIISFKNEKISKKFKNRN